MSTSLQKALSRYEKITKMIANLESMKAQGEIAEEQFTEFKSNYEVLQTDALANVKEIRAKLKEERAALQTQLEGLTKQASTIEIRGKTGELTPQQVGQQLDGLNAQIEQLQQRLTRLDALLAARSTSDLGGAVDVDVNERVEYQPTPQPSRRSADNALGGVTEKVKAFKESETGQSLTKAADRVKGKVTEVSRDPKQHLPLIIGVAGGVAALLLIVVIAFFAIGGCGEEQAPDPALPFWMTSQDPEAELVAACAGCTTIIILLILGIIALDVILVIWVARDAKARGMDSPAMWPILVFFTGIIGLIIYLVSRPPGELIVCAHCSNKRLQSSAQCPHCGNA